MKVVLHICCGVCAAGAAERLKAEDHEVIGFFCNPNIYPEEEYRKRLEVARETSRLLSFPLREGSYLPEAWREKIRGWEDAPEGGERCEICFRVRLEETFNFMKDQGADAFTSTLTISPHKSAEAIFRIGKTIGGEKFLARDFKKKDGFKRSQEIAREKNLYRQDYCGCVYSLKSAKS
jgi:hypothetical protein